VAQKIWRDFLYVNVVNWSPSGDKMEYVYQEFTGLKDKFGEDIYEGDILEDSFSTYKVEFHDGMFLLMDIPCKVTIQDVRQDCSIEEIPLMTIMGADSAMKIIGNIFETPELLK
jgi:uncharacterized phage protein (TIGR01671 family)